MKPSITLLLHNIRSAHNVGAIFRTAEGFGAKELIFSGYTPYPDLSLQPTTPGTYLKNTTYQADPRLPHIRQKITHQIHKTALGAENIVPFRVFTSMEGWLRENEENAKLPIIALEQSATSIMLPEFQPPEAFALLLGEEVNGISPELLTRCDHIVEIPMFGEKESFNVSVAAGIALYGLTVRN